MSSIPVIDAAEQKSAANAWIQKLPICPLCGKQMLDYITIYDDKGVKKYECCTVHHDDKDSYHNVMVTEITGISG